MSPLGINLTEQSTPIQIGSSTPFSQSNALSSTPYLLENQDSRVLSQLAQLRYKVFRDTSKFSSATYGWMCLKLKDGWTKVNRQANNHLLLIEPTDHVSSDYRMI